MKLIDILNMISKGELKEGTKIKWENDIYTYGGKICFERENGYDLLEDMYLSNLNDECELIEPECKHEWKKYSIGRLGIMENHRKCKKCGIDEIEPDHFTDVGKMTEKIEELDNYDWQEGDYDYQIEILYRKLNQVIRRINNVR